MCELLGEKVKSMKKRNLILLALLICLTGCGAQSGADQVEVSDVYVTESVTTESEVESEDINESTSIVVNVTENTVEIETTSSEETESVTTIEAEENSTVKLENTEAYDEKLESIFESIVGEYDDDVELEHMLIVEETDWNGAKYAISSIAFPTLYDTNVYEYDEKEIHFHRVEDWGYESWYVLYIYDEHLEIYNENYETGEDGKLLGAATFSTRR